MSAMRRTPSYGCGAAAIPASRGEARLCRRRTQAREAGHRGSPHRAALDGNGWPRRVAVARREWWRSPVSRCFANRPRREHVLLGLNAEGKLKQPLKVVIPADGVVTADYPLTLLSGADEPSRDAYAAVTEWLRSPVAQKMIMDQTSRRPAVPGIELDARFGDWLLVELPFPAQQAVVDDLITS
jgi:hypothetical protein